MQRHRRVRHIRQHRPLGVRTARPAGATLAVRPVVGQQQPLEQIDRLFERRVVVADQRKVLVQSLDALGGFADAREGRANELGVGGGG